MPQKFYASPANRREFSNGAIGYGPGGSFDCLGPYAKVSKCPVIVDGKEVARLTCYATNYADTFFSVPACSRRKNHYVSGFFMMDGEGGIQFIPAKRYHHLFQEAS
jgi:hypothetical protein